MLQALEGFPGPAPMEWGIVEDRYSQWGLCQDIKAGGSLTHLGNHPQAPCLDFEGGMLRDEAKRPGWWRPHSISNTMLESKFMGCT